MRRRLILILAGLLLAAAGVFIAVYPRSRKGPNVILISIDSLRPDHLGCYGHDRNTSPFLDRLASEGALFESAASSTSWTLPAHAALFTGMPDRVHGCMMNTLWLDRSRTTLAERFRSSGYRTAGFFSRPYLHPSFGLDQGFDRYQDCTSYSGETASGLKEGIRDLNRLSHGDLTNPTILREVTKWLDQDSDGPAFVFIHMWDVHYDYIPPAPYDTLFDPDYEGPVDGRNVGRTSRKPKGWTARDVEHLKALYDGEIRWTDDTIQKLFNLLSAE